MKHESDRKTAQTLRLFPKYYVGQHGPQLPHHAVMQTFAFVLSVFGLVAATCWTIISGILDVNNVVEDTSMFQRSGAVLVAFVVLHELFGDHIHIARPNFAGETAEALFAEAKERRVRLIQNWHRFALFLTVLGTAIWAYGDFLFNNYDAV